MIWKCVSRRRLRSEPRSPGYLHRAARVSFLNQLYLSFASTPGGSNIPTFERPGIRILD